MVYHEYWYFFNVINVGGGPGVGQCKRNLISGYPECPNDIKHVEGVY